MKKKGFTLIELLAVIVILAIIALIATPIVMNVIENSKKGAAERSAENYLRAVETAVAAERLDGLITDGEYDIQDDGSICPKAGCVIDGVDKKVSIDMSGNKPSDGTVKIANGQVTLTNTTMKIGDYTVSYDSTKKIFVAEKSGATNTSVTVYRYSTEEIKIGDEIDLTDTSKFKLSPTTLGNFYLKHVLNKDNIIIESYACIMLDSDKVCVKGGVDENGNSYYNENKQILEGLEELEDSGFNCSFDNYYSSCFNDDGTGIRAELDGIVYSYYRDNTCTVFESGSSYCNV